MRNSIVFRPLISEKSFRLAAERQYSFVVDRSATASDIAHAIESLYSVKVTSVRTMNLSGKITRYKGYSGRRNHWKKAMVTLAEGQSIEGFTAIAADEDTHNHELETKESKTSAPRTKRGVSTTVRVPKAQKEKANETSRASSSGQSPKDVE